MAGLKDPINQLKLFVYGPTGVGKTELAKRPGTGNEHETCTL